MRTDTVNISFKSDLLREIDRWARREYRNRSEFIRAAARDYIERKKNWLRLFSFGVKQSRRLHLKESSVSSAIADYRKYKRRARS